LLSGESKKSGARRQALKRAGNAEKYEKNEENQLTDEGFFDTMKKRQKTAGQKKPPKSAGTLTTP
jgi:hypothetical protein